MKLALLFVALSLANTVWASDQAAIQSQRVALENFESYPSRAFPQAWKVRGSEEEARMVYRVAEENGNRFLHAHAEKQSVQIGMMRAFPPTQYPILQWRWRVKALPVGADERVGQTNDSAAGVYVVFDNTITPRVIKYVWSAVLPQGIQIDSPSYWRAKVVVLESGAPTTGDWTQETVNVYEDYKKLFGDEPGEVEGVALLTDSDTTGSVAEADYDDFALLPARIAQAGAGDEVAISSLAPTTSK
ncbi:MAG: DUF3047 domain-containing protein [Deltaproteobacteria bacterium]|nr:DUF3047 domain-containing protein [Deltaproteobacteria bacterium]